MAEDYYKILGVSRTATPEELKGAYRGLALKFHPDVNKSIDATENFKKINEAYAVLSNTEKKAAYDSMGAETFSQRYTKDDIFRDFDYRSVLKDLFDNILVSFSEDPKYTDNDKNKAKAAALIEGLVLFFWYFTKDED